MTKTTRSYRYGGPLVVGEDYYISRKADDQLLQWCMQAEYAYIFNASQTGKSSLLERTRHELDQRGIQAIYLDLQGLGSTGDAEKWYSNVADMIAEKLRLGTNVETWWAAHSSQMPTRRWMNFFEQVVLIEIEDPLVIFIDEVDRTRSLPFREDLYGALRSLYGGRATQPKLRRLSFVLAGLAAPRELIADSTHTVHNIWKAVSLGDLTEKDGAIDALADGLGLATTERRKEALEWIISWTGGHPYLTQKLCALVQAQEWTDCEVQDVDQLVSEEFFHGEKEDNNLAYVERELTKERESDMTRNALLAEYERLLMDGKVRDMNTASQAELKFTGVVRTDEGWLRIRNRIYQGVFNKAWLKQHFRHSLRDWWVTQPRPVKRLAAVISLIITVLFFALILVVAAMST
jgi:hypothetical protein